jgi:hypothetical protein
VVVPLFRLTVDRILSVDMEIELVCCFNEFIHFFAKYKIRGL